MSQGQIHFEVFARRTPNSRLALELATEDRAEALAHAELSLKEGAIAARVSKEMLDTETGRYSSVTIFKKGDLGSRHLKAVAHDAGPTCVTPQDLYSIHARQRIVRLLDSWLGRNRVTPFELLHRADLAEKLEASGTELQHAVQKIAIPEAQARGVSVHEVIRAFNLLIERSIERLLKDARGKTFANFKTEPFSVACARLVEDPEAGYRLGGGVADYIADASSWRGKIDRLLDLAESAPADPRSRALAFEVLEQPLGEILGSRAGIAELLGSELDLGGNLAAMTALACSQVVEAIAQIDYAFERAIPPLTGAAQRLSKWMEGSHFPAVRTAIGKRIIAEIKSARRLRPGGGTQEEIAVLRALAMALTASQGKMLSGDDIREAFIERSAMLVGNEFVNAVVAETETALQEVRALLRLAENVTGLSNKTQAAQWLIGAVGALRFEREIRDSRDLPLNRLGILADLQRAVGRVDLPEAEKTILFRRLGELGGQIEADSHLVQTVTRSSLTSAQQIDVLCKMAMGETVPSGPAAQRAREAAVRIGRSPEFRADLVKSPEMIEKLRPLMTAG